MNPKEFGSRARVPNGLDKVTIFDIEFGVNILMDNEYDE